jgi:hypothetical protein
VTIKWRNRTTTSRTLASYQNPTEIVVLVIRHGHVRITSVRRRRGYRRFSNGISNARVKIALPWSKLYPNALLRFRKFTVRCHNQSDVNAKAKGTRNNTPAKFWRRVDAPSLFRVLGGGRARSERMALDNSTLKVELGARIGSRSFCTTHARRNSGNSSLVR